MASIFLSYVREDAEKARALAAHLERAGHSVWWDRRIKGGAQFSAEIEAALNAADKVVVLWSAQSVRSAWVRDEAAAGRDSGRLVPVALDETAPPLGFRQFQTVELRNWKGNTPPAQVQDLLDAVADEGTPPVATRAAASPRKPFRLAVPRRAMVALALATLAVIAVGWWWADRRDSHIPVIAIDAPDGSPTSREIARQLSVRLGDFQAARSDAFRLVPGASGDVVLQVHATDSPTALNRDLTVLSGGDKSILWSTSMQQPPAKAGDLSQQLTTTTQRVVACALDALSDDQERVDPLVLKQYLNGCSRLESDYGLGDYDPNLSALFQHVVAQAPHLAGAWARLLQTETEGARDADPGQEVVNNLRKHIDQAEKLHLDIGEIYAAKSVLLPVSDFLKIFALLDHGIQAAAYNPYLYRLRSERLQAVGRMNDSVTDASAALGLDPLSPALLDNYVSALAYAGKIEAAYAQLRNAETMWPAAQNLKYARYRLDLRFGDAKEALAILRKSGSAPLQAQESFLIARIDPSAQNVQRVVDDERMTNGQEPRYIAGLMQALAQFSRNAEAIDVLINYKRPDAIGYNAEVLFRPAFRQMWRDPRSMAGAAHVGLLAYWKKSGKWPDFCFDPTLPYDCKKEAAKYPV